MKQRKPKQYKQDRPAKEKPLKKSFLKRLDKISRGKFIAVKDFAKRYGLK